jgi:catechol 2,3-dioxygenase-like lactoylglutathione lyase family enzyme
MAGGPVLNLVTVIVADMEAAVAFYRRLGVAIPDGDPEWGHMHRSATLPSGANLDFDSVEFVPTWDKGWSGPGAGSSVIGFAVETREQVDVIHADMTAAGFASEQEPFDAFWGARYAMLADPDGNLVGIMSPIDPSTQGPPPE